jgi:hypothetical protein
MKCPVLGGVAKAGRAYLREFLPTMQYLAVSYQKHNLVECDKWQESRSLATISAVELS